MPLLVSACSRCGAHYTADLAAFTNLFVVLKELERKAAKCGTECEIKNLHVVFDSKMIKDIIR